MHGATFSLEVKKGETLIHNFVEAARKFGFSDDGSESFVLNVNGDLGVRVSLDSRDPRIEYHPEIKIEHRGALSPEKEENLVTAICIAQLLKKGYEPSSITLEKTWKLGHQNKGRLDILVSEPRARGSASPWMMIECKVSHEHEAFASKMRNDGGQLFSYWFQDRAAKFLYLYSVDLSNGEVRADFIRTSDLDTSAQSVDALHASWDGTFETLGAFHELALAYDSETRLLRPEDLKSLDASTGKGLFNNFVELLRQYSVSDKSNGFNKIFNLFLCKIIDEDNAKPGSPMMFQDDGRSDGRALLMELDRLYRLGLEQYLGITVHRDYVSSAQNFAFIDVYDEQSFDRNMRILRGVVRILQPYKIKYSTKQQHLGDFFELLLNEGIKQESGQYFTPVPLTSFAVRALPLARIVRDAVARGGDAIFPRVIDFACGSGHFLTEAIDLLERQIQQVDEASLSSQRDRQIWASRKSGYLWAKDAVFGIEKDYRLAKVTKIATFLNGDGDASILHGDGLDPFSSYSFKGILRADTADNPIFDIVVANPPYSVPNFLESSGAKRAIFSLKSYIKPKGSEIEILFIERMAQLLRAQGVAALVLPAGIFTNESVSYEKARRFLIANFKVRGLLNLGKDAFMATGIKTALLFLEKRESPLAADEDDEASLVSVKRQLGAEKTLVAWMDQGQEEKNYLGYAFSNRRGYEGIQIYERSSLFASEASIADQVELDEKLPYLDDLIRASFDNPDTVESLISSTLEKLDNLPETLRHDLLPVYSNLRFASTDELIELGAPSFRINTRASELDSSNRFEFASAGLASSTIGELLELGQISITSGKRPKGGVARNRSGIVSLGGEHIDERLGKVDISKPKFVPADFLNDEKVSDMSLRPGDLLICKDGARSGKVAIVEPGDLKEHQLLLINEHLLRVRLEDDSLGFQLRLTYIFFFSREGRAELDSAIAGTGQGGISVSRLKKVRMPRLDHASTLRILGCFDEGNFEQGYSFENLVASALSNPS